MLSDNQGIQDSRFGYLSSLLLDYLFPNPAHELSKFHLDGFTCDVCKGGSWLLRTLLGNRLVFDLIVFIGKIGCKFVIPYVGYESSTCPGIIDMQFADSILPILLFEVLDSRNLCSFELQVCQLDDYVQRDLNVDVFHMTNSKPPIAKANNFINNLYQE